jgi:hypothetical protein
MPVKSSIFKPMKRNFANGKYLIAAMLLLLIIQGCSNKYSFRDVSSFKIDTAVLKADEPIEVIYVSGGPDYNNKAEYFYHYMVVSKQTGDTVNLLSPYVYMKLSEENRFFNFIPYHSSSGKLLMQSMISGMGGDASNVPEIDSMVLPQPTKVVVNHDFEEVGNNHYRTTVGFLGTVNAGTTAH